MPGRRTGGPRPGCGTYRSNGSGAVRSWPRGSAPPTWPCGWPTARSITGWSPIRWPRSTRSTRPGSTASTWWPTTRHSIRSCGGCPVSRDSTVRIALLLPEILGTYGDGGNAVVLAQRLRWRDIPAEVVTVTGADGSVPATCDIYLLRGGEGTAHADTARHLAET